MTKIKICGLTREEDILVVSAAMPDYVGFVFAEHSRRYVSAERAASMRRGLPRGILAVGVFVNAGADTIARTAETASLDLVQLHGDETPEEAARIKRITGLPVIKAVSMTESAERELALWDGSDADYILADSGSGGTGVRFASRKIDVKKPLFIAGGLTPDSIAEAIAEYSPFAVDISSGVEINGIKDGGLIAEAVRRTREHE